jgi:hypothetical protein
MESHSECLDLSYACFCEILSLGAFLFAQYAKRFYKNTVDIDTNGRKNEEIMYATRNFQVGANQFKFIAKFLAYI